MAVSRKLRRYRGWIALGALVVIGAVAFAVVRSMKEPPAKTTYTTEQAGIGTLSVTVAGTGNLEMRDLVEVYPVGSGTADSVDVETGDAVKAGDTLYTLDADEAKAATAKAYASYRQAVEGVKRAESTLFKARKTLSELEDLQDEQEDAASKPSTSTVSQNTDEVTDNDIKAAEKDVATAKAGVTSAEAQCSSALLAYEQTKTAQGNLTVTAPVSGIVWAVNVEEGGSVSSGGGSSGASGQNAATTTSSSSSAPVSIATDGELAVMLSVNEVDVPSLEVGQRAELAFDALPDLAIPAPLPRSRPRAPSTKASSPTTSGSRSTSRTRSSQAGCPPRQRSSPPSHATSCWYPTPRSSPTTRESTCR